MRPSVPEFERWFDRRLARTNRAVRRLERLRRRRFWRLVLMVALVLSYGSYSLAPFVSELVGAYSPGELP